MDWHGRPGACKKHKQNSHPFDSQYENFDFVYVSSDTGIRILYAGHWLQLKRGAFIRKLRDYLGIFVWLATCGAEWIFAELTKPDWQDRFVSILLKINQILITH